MASGLLLEAGGVGANHQVAVWRDLFDTRGLAAAAAAAAFASAVTAATAVTTATAVTAATAVGPA